MSRQPHETQIFGASDNSREPLRVRVVEPASAHAAIDLQVIRQARTGAAGLTIPALDLTFVLNERRQPEFGSHFLFTLQEASEDSDLSSDPGIP